MLCFENEHMTQQKRPPFVEACVATPAGPVLQDASASSVALQISFTEVQAVHTEQGVSLATPPSVDPVLRDTFYENKLDTNTADTEQVIVSPNTPRQGPLTQLSSFSTHNQTRRACLTSMLHGPFWEGHVPKVLQHDRNWSVRSTSPSLSSASARRL
ncbi:uncharacterized protein LOC135372377 [Ornithodoros turicata]|uniref:uncharacterized protein LOC135372377 n=1 Tax=Ornithodoros turicata TaxID=34597 RepID=UPI003139B959